MSLQNYCHVFLKPQSFTETIVACFDDFLTSQYFILFINDEKISKHITLTFRWSPLTPSCPCQTIKFLYWNLNMVIANSLRLSSVPGVMICCVYKFWWMIIFSGHISTRSSCHSEESDQGSNIDEEIHFFSFPVVTLKLAPSRSHCSSSGAPPLSEPS